jgi:hypothetical protein
LKRHVADVVFLKQISIFFFLCPFAKAACFINPWFFRREVLTQNVNSFATVLNFILSLNHPKAILNLLATFLWKARNDELFCRKKTRPRQISMHAKDLLKDLEVLPQQNPLQSPKPHINLNTRVWSVLETR